MPSWLLKAAVQGAISVLPGRHRLNALLQQHVTGSLPLTASVFDGKVAQCAHHLTRFREARATDRPPDAALELGTGWYPIVPIGLALAGVREVTTIDVTSLVGPDRVRRALELFAAALESGRLATALPATDPARVETVLAAARDHIAPPDEVLARVGVRAMVGDARVSGLPAGSIDLVVSNNTLEHIPPHVLEEIVFEFRRVSAPGAVMDHFVDISDHYAHFDSSITEFNYLRYGPRTWRLVNNRLQYQNRLRASDYRRLIESAGLRVIAEEIERGTPEQLAQITVAAPFHAYAREDLLILRMWLTAVA